ncbi:alpha/beta fold hydrolase [Chenggangzhangella methanolivorans]|uniref:Alpha/beta hydrolase n=1 Tax=Chenggangzhangella methanolivorans TaxID=1437009 RepID=A0A9E6RCF6_9HYPH|nr:alpha/beta hydrolase [Chenggangzhangella methanolivorans]QZO01692.1 alpha/beta hydrolase [Chenggangzhangella methanolivorans]
MPFVTTADGTNIFYKDWGPKDARPIVFSHGWPLCSDAWDGQMLFLVQQGFRVVAHDRRGHGRSDQPSSGNDMDTYADDLAAVLDALDIRNAVMVGHSTGGGEVAHYLGRHGSSRAAKAVLIGAVPPIMVSTAQWPDGLDISVFDGIRNGVFDNRSNFYLELAIPFYGMNRGGVAINDGLRHTFWNQGMMGGIIGQYACVREFSEVDYTPDLEKIDIPVLVIHGDDDQIVPIAHAGALTAKIVKGAVLKIYQGAPHGLASTHQDKLNADLLAFAKD